jgi:hypothetical protein
MPPNYAAEGRIRQICADNHVLESAIEDFVDEFRTHVFDEKDITAHIAKTRTDKPNRWVINGTESDQLLVDAFGPERTLKAQGEVVKQFGEDRAKEYAAQFNTTLGGKPGVVPDTLKSKKNGSDTNPFKALRDPRTGKINPAVEKQISSLIVAVGTAKASAIARSAGLSITGLPLSR